MNASAIQKTCNRIISHSECTSSSASIAYTYTDDRLTFVSVNDTTEYTLTYDEFGRSLATVAGSAWRGTSTTLSTNAYDEYGKLDRTTYGNGFVVSYVYDSLDRVIAVKFNDTVAYRYTYNGEGDLYSAQDVALGYTIYYEYDHAGRCMASTTKSDSTGAVLASYSYEYDLNNNLSKLTCTTNGTTWTTTYTYDGDNRPTATTLANGKTVTNTYDALGRITRKRIGLSSNYDTTYTYLAGANNSQTALLASYQNGSDTAYTYTYDENGNITSISQGGSTTYYTYDRLNELIREDNAILNQSWTYTYDTNGNLLNKKRYAYVPNGGTLGACLETISYGYDAAYQDWADQLTSYNGETIRYDDSGNPISYRGYTMAWQGKRLTSATKTGTAVSYSYDENGIRTQKTVNGVSTNYYYNGSVLISQVSGNDTLLFSYDANGSVVSVNFNGTDYYYVRNGQGDVVKLIDGNGATVTEYTYDTWGKLLSCTGSLSTTLGTLNPFRYRGYVYDNETGFYYLQSRYYDPEVCRFINADVYLSTGQGVLGHNTYAYCLNNPVNRGDPSGCVSKKDRLLTESDKFYGGGSLDDDSIDYTVLIQLFEILDSVFGAEYSSSLSSVSNTKVILPDYLPLSIKTGFRLNQTGVSIGDSSKPLSLFLDQDAIDILCSNGGVRFNIGNLKYELSMGLDDAGFSVTWRFGNKSYSFKQYGSIYDFKAGLELSCSTLLPSNGSQTSYTDIGVSGYWIAATLYLVLSGDVTPLTSPNTAPSYGY